MASVLRGERTIQRSAWERTRSKSAYILLGEGNFIPLLLHHIIHRTNPHSPRFIQKKKKTYAIELELSLKREIFLSGPEEIPLYFCLSLSFRAMGRSVCQAERHVWRCNKNSRCVWLHRTRYINPPPPGGVFRGETCCVHRRIKT